MDDVEGLRRELRRIDGRGYKAYRDVKGEWSFPGWTLDVAWVQGDPFAAPSRVRALLEPHEAALPAVVLEGASRRVGVACHLARVFAREARDAASSRGSGRSGTIRMEDPGQQVMPQTAVRVDADGSVEARFRVGLPARGRRVLGEEAEALLTEDVPGLVRSTLTGGAHDPDDLIRAAETNEDADHLRAGLTERGLVAFVADAAILPRRSGVDDRPLEADGGGSGRQPGAEPSPVVPFESPPSLRVAVDLPNAGTVEGMGVPAGVTLIVGGGFHGKSTLLRALERGVYNHRPGDGRERVVADGRAVKIRAEDGRSVTGVDISPFIDRLPFGTNTHRFTTADASGSTSQAAAIVEALEAGATTLLVDEDTSATNFMIRDRRMQALVPRAGEPITPFVDRARDLHDDLGVSSVLVVGGSGDYLDVADTVVAMRDYRPADVTDRAHAVAAEHPTGRMPETGGAFTERPERVPRADSIEPRRGRRSVSVKVRGLDRLLFGTEEIDLSAVEQLVSPAQVRAVGQALALAHRLLGRETRTVPRLLDAVVAAVAEEGLDVLDPRGPGDLAAFRRFELAAALNRLRTLELAT